MNNFFEEKNWENILKLAYKMKVDIRHAVVNVDLRLNQKLCLSGRNGQAELQKVILFEKKFLFYDFFF